MRKFLIFIGIVVAVFATSCKKDTSVTGNLKECFYFEAVEAGAVVSMENDILAGYEVLNVKLEYSTDESHWSPFVVDETSVILENVGDKVYVRANATNDKFCDIDEDYGEKGGVVY